jgi:1-phosphatidylinositol-4-phosphate 5-kinase
LTNHKQEKFQKLLDLDRITRSDLISSFSLESNQKTIFKAQESAGASGSFFFFSSDNKFIIKTLRNNEKDLLLGLLDDYSDHIESSNNYSLLTRIYGLYTL